jgi:tetratricopeptide (TPR) repeat protein
VRAATKLNAAAIAYLALLALGPVSFVMHRAALRSWRLTVWLPFAALAAWQARTIPYFAIVAAPITVLNLQDFAASAVENTGSRPRPRNLLISLSPCLLVSGLLGLICLAWLGWLAGLGRDDRRVAWDVQPEPSLQRAAEILHRWRQEKSLVDGEAIFAVAPEITGYLAWFDPGEKQFFDHRYPLFAVVARDYETVCRALQPELVPARSSLTPAERGKSWRQVLRDRGVGIIVYYEREPQRLLGVLRRLASDPEHWTLLDVAGQVLIVGWNEARPAGGFDPMAFDPDRLAFGLPFEHALPSAPDQGPEQLPGPRSWFDRLAPQASTSTAWESAAATAYLYYFNIPEVAEHQRNQQWRKCSVPKYAATLAGLPALPPAVFSTAIQLTSSRRLLFPEDTAPRFLSRGELGPYFAHLLDRPPALPLLAVRAARRAVAVNPRDANAWLRLGHAYLLLRNFTVERSAEGLLPPLDQVRHVQIVTALEQAVRLNPDFEAAHHELAVLYGQRKYLDLALEHQREELRLAGLLDRRPVESADEFAGRSNRLESLVNDIDKLTEQVRDSHQKYAANSRALQGDRLAQADMALKLGLAQQAVEEVLLATPAEVLGAAGIKLELEMLLLVGRIDEVRSILGDPSLEASKHGLRQNELFAPQDGNGRPLYPVPYRWSAFEWLRVLQSAAVGDYAQAYADLGALRDELGAGRKRMQDRLTGFDDRVWQFLPGLLSGPSPLAQAFTAYSLQQVVDEKGALEIGESALRAQQADLWVLEGLFALEQGNTRAARSAFSEAMKLEAQPAAAAVSFAGAPIAADYLSKLRVEYRSGWPK